MVWWTPYKKAYTTRVAKRKIRQAGNFDKLKTNSEASLRLAHIKSKFKY